MADTAYTGYGQPVDHCKVAPPAPTPITQAITPCPATFPMVWNYDGATYPTIGAFVNAYKAAMLPVVVTFVAPCTFSAPDGTVFLPTALSAIVVVPPTVVYCPSQPLLDGGFGYHIADPKDPAATVEIAPCPGDTSTDSIWVYPTAGAGRTAKVTACDGTTIGYGANQSNCAVACPCPDMNVTVNNAAPVNNVSVAAPVVNLPAPNVVGAGYDANGKLTITRSDGTTVQTADLPSC
jgi:hypothetical protein